MGKLTPMTYAARVHSFAHGISMGKDAVSAYRDSGFRSRANKATAKAAHTLLHKPEVQRLVQQLVEKRIDDGEVNLQSHLKNLAKLRDAALEAGRHSAAIQAEHYRGRAAGLYVDRLVADISVNAHETELMTLLERTGGGLVIEGNAKRVTFDQLDHQAEKQMEFEQANSDNDKRSVLNEALHIKRGFIDIDKPLVEDVPEPDPIPGVDI